MNWLFFVHWNDTLTLKCVNFVNFVNFWKEKSHRFAMGFSYLSAAELFVFSGTPEISDFWGEPPRGPQRALLEWGELKPKSPQLLRSSGFLRP